MTNNYYHSWLDPILEIIKLHIPNQQNPSIANLAQSILVLKWFPVSTNRSSVNTVNLHKSFGNRLNSVNTNSDQLFFVNHGNLVNTTSYHNFLRHLSELGRHYLTTDMTFVWHQRQHTIRQLYPTISLFGIDGNTTCHSMMKFENKTKNFSLIYFTKHFFFM